MIRILNKTDSILLLENNYIGNLAYIFRNQPFIAPITYYFDKEQHIIIGYSAEGHKITAMRKCNSVSLHVGEIESVNNWKSILVHGTYQELTGTDAKAQLHNFSTGVKHIITIKKHKELDFISQFSSKIYKNDIPIVFIIKIEQITGRIRQI